MVIHSIDALKDIYDALESAEQNGEEKLGGKNPCVTALYECDGLVAIEKLQSHPSSDVYEAVSKFIDEYLVTE